MKDKHIPFDKSWAIRCIYLDMLAGKRDIGTQDLGNNMAAVSDDIERAWAAHNHWHNGERNLNVGESATLYRFMKYLFWHWYEEDVVLTKEGTLLKRMIENDRSKIWGKSFEELLKLDGGTSQWASAALMCGNLNISNIDPAKMPHKFVVTLQAMAHWNVSERYNDRWRARKDPTIKAQAELFEAAMNGTARPDDWEPTQAEDYCLARAFSYMSAKEGQARWPQLQNHESNRIVEMEKAIRAVLDDKEVISDDHRVVQASAMLAKVINRNKVTYSNKNCVRKSWPQFWEFLKSYDKD
jgi:hypothetical protein